MNNRKDKYLNLTDAKNFEDFVNECKFDLIFPGAILKIYLPNGSVIKTNSKIGAAVLVWREEAIDMLLRFLKREGIELKQPVDKKAALLFINRKMERKCREDVETFFYYLLFKTVDKIVEKEKFLLVFDNAIYLDREKGIISFSRRTAYNTSLKIWRELRKRIYIDNILRKGGINYKTKYLSGMVVDINRDIKDVSRTIYEIRYPFSIVPLYNILRPFFEERMKNIMKIEYTYPFSDVILILENE